MKLDNYIVVHYVLSDILVVEQKLGPCDLLSRYSGALIASL